MGCPEESPCFFADYGPKGCRGERREAGIQWIQPPKAVSDPEFRQTTSGAHGSAGRADCLPRGKPFGAPAGAYPCPRWGLTRRLRRGLGLAVPWGAHTFLSVAKEKCAKESQRHGDSGKKPFIAHFGGGARYVARSGVGQLRLLSCALGARLFPPSKWAGLFPSAAYRRSAPPQLAMGIRSPCGLGCFGVAWKFLQRRCFGVAGGFLQCKRPA